MLEIKELKMIPKHEKTDDGYKYPDEYIGKIFKHGDEYIYFSKASITKLPIEFVNQIIELIRSSISLEEPNEDIDVLNSRITDLENTIQELRIKLEDAEKLIDSKLTEAYENFMPAIEDAINKKVAALETAKSSNSKGGALSLSQLMALKEQFNADEIVKMREAGLI